MRGFVALMSVIIISAILMVYVYLVSASSFLARFDALDGEDKTVSEALAHACVNAAVLELAESDASTGKVTVDTDDPQKTCEICGITPSGSIQTRAVYHGAYTNLSVTVDPTIATYPITSWEELPTYTGPSCDLVQ